MQKRQLLIISLLATIFIAGCTWALIDMQTTNVGKLIFDQEGIKTIEVFKGASGQPSVTICDSTNISTLISNVKEIPVNRLSDREDNSFSPTRIQDDSILIICFYSDNTSSESLKGEFFIWPDGYIYTVDVKSMKGNQRTISYLSESKYPDIYQWLIDKSKQPQ